MKVIKEIKVKEYCEINKENPTPSKEYCNTVVNVVSKDDSSGFVNFTFGADIEQQCCEDFNVIYPDSYEYEKVYVHHITVLKDGDDEEYDNVIVNILIHNEDYEYKYLTFVVSNETHYYTHTVYFDENNELAYECEI